MKVSVFHDIQYTRFTNVLFDTCLNYQAFFVCLFVVCLFVCLGFYAVSKVFQLFNADSSQIHVSWTIFNQYLPSPLS